MKTAMQTTIDKMNEAKEHLPPFGFHDEFLRGFNKAFQMAVFIAEKNGLEAEKEQITEAYHKGQVAIFDIIKAKFPQHKFEATQHEFDLVESGKEKNEDAEDYYQQTYNQEQ